MRRTSTPRRRSALATSRGSRWANFPRRAAWASRSASPPERSDAYLTLHIMMRKQILECVTRRSVACRRPHGLRQRQADGGERQSQSAGAGRSRRRCSRMRRSARLAAIRGSSFEHGSRALWAQHYAEIQYAEADRQPAAQRDHRGILGRASTSGALAGLQPDSHAVGGQPEPGRPRARDARLHWSRTMTDFWGDIPLHGSRAGSDELHAEVRRAVGDLRQPLRVAHHGGVAS